MFSCLLFCCSLLFTGCILSNPLHDSIKLIGVEENWQVCTASFLFYFLFLFDNHNTEIIHLYKGNIKNVIINPERKDSNMLKILVVEDDRKLNQTLSYTLNKEKYDVSSYFCQ